MRRALGGLLIAAGIFLILASVTQIATEGGHGGVILIGPIPVVWGSSPEMALASMLLAAALMLFSLLLMGRRWW